MSEDDIDMLGPDGQASSSRVDRDRRAPRFSWTPAYETTFFRSLCASVQLGLRENSSFKAEAWERAAQALQECHGAYPAKSHLINKSDNARKRFRLWRGLREAPGFAYNPVSKTVTATEDAWKAHIEVSRCRVGQGRASRKGEKKRRQNGNRTINTDGTDMRHRENLFQEPSAVDRSIMKNTWRCCIPM